VDGARLAAATAGTALFAVAVWSVLFSLLLAAVSLFVLGAICLLCSGLYIVNLALLVATLRLFTAVRVGAASRAHGKIAPASSPACAVRRCCC
jgi:uncharacterized membrane protein